MKELVSYINHNIIIALKSCNVEELRDDRSEDRDLKLLSKSNVQFQNGTLEIEKSDIDEKNYD